MPEKQYTPVAGIAASGECSMAGRWMLPYLNKRCPVLIKNRLRRHLISCGACRHILRDLLAENHRE